MPDSDPPHLSSWFSKLLECLFFCIALAGFVYMMISTWGIAHPDSNRESYFVKVFQYAIILFVIFSIGYSVWWHRKEKKCAINSGIKHAWLRGVLRYFIAYQISMYGFGKIFKTQFTTFYSRNDLTVNSLSGFDLTWNYFGYSHTFAVILGLIQIGGAILLLFRRTSLLGVCILVPVMVNIVLINVFYDIAPGAFINSLILTSGLLYLLLLRWRELKAFFFSESANLPAIRIGFLKPILKLLTIAAAFFGIYYYVITRAATEFEGKWKVQELTRNGKTVDKNNWQVNPNSWCNIYMEERGQMYLSPNPYIFDEERARSAEYRYDSQKHILKLIFAHVDTETVAVSNYNGKHMQWNTILDNDTLQMQLTKVEKTAY